MRKITVLSALIFAFCTHLAAQTATLQEKAESLANDHVFHNAITGISVVSGRGDFLAGVNADKMLVPASNMKLISIVQSWG